MHKPVILSGVTQRNHFMQPGASTWGALQSHSWCASVTQSMVVGWQLHRGGTNSHKQHLCTMLPVFWGTRMWVSVSQRQAYVYMLQGSVVDPDSHWCADPLAIQLMYCVSIGLDRMRLKCLKGKQSLSHDLILKHCVPCTTTTPCAVFQCQYDSSHRGY